MDAGHIRRIANVWIAEASRRRILEGLFGGSFGLFGATHSEEAFARKCKKGKGKKRRKKCRQKSRDRNEQGARPPEDPPGDRPPPNPSGADINFPVRAAFYYPWFPKAWKQSGFDPFTNYQPALGYYDGGDAAVISQQIAAMQYGGISLGIASWWGIGDDTDEKLPTLLATAAGTGFYWTIYYEDEGTSHPSVEQIRSDLTHIRDHYASDPSYARVDGKFVVFVYNADDATCEVADRWQQANTVGAYVVLKVFQGFGACSAQPQSWHQYAPAVAADHQAGYSYSISPGFWQKGQAVRLPRDLARWQQNVRDMAASAAPWQLVTTFNEWGEGTSVESAVEWESASGYGAYLDVLHRDGRP